MKQYPSIFNDVIGPVMIGSSSSHTAAAVRIGNMIRQLAGGRNVRNIKFSFDEESSLAATYISQGSDIGLLAGLLGYETYNEAIPKALEHAKQAGIDYSFEVKNIGPGHPNTYYVEYTTHDGRQRSLRALSLGGGMIELTDYMGFPLSIDGGFFEMLIICDSSESEAVVKKIGETLINRHIVNVSDMSGTSLINIKSEVYFEFDFETVDIYKIEPIMPVKSQLNPSVPFVSADEISNYAKNNNLSLWELAVVYESERSSLSADAVMDKMREIVSILRQSLNTPINNDIPDRILPNQAHLIENSNTLGGSFNKSIIKYVTKFMDIKTSMGIFVAAPTAGSCGCVSGCIFALAEELGLNDDDMAKAFLAAGLIGVIIAHRSTFAAEVCGCQAECGAGSGMCAAACVTILNGSLEECLSAASMALQNILGLVCDPVGNRVEVPCLGRNILAAVGAVASANMAVSGYDQVIPLDETIEAMDSVGRAIPRELRCTGLGGLSVTKTSLAILEKRDFNND